MNINKNWLWQYQIDFEEKLKLQVINKADTLKPNLKQLFLKEINEFSLLFTPQMLLDKVFNETKKLDKIDIKDMISNHYLFKELLYKSY